MSLRADLNKLRRRSGREYRLPLEAIAWLNCAERIISGKRDSGRITALAAFRFQVPR